MKEEKEQGKGFGLASCILGSISIPICFMPYFGIFFSILAIIFAVVQNKKVKTGTATAGLITGIIGTVLNVVMLFFVFIYILIAGIPV